MKRLLLVPLVALTLSGCAGSNIGGVGTTMTLADILAAIRTETTTVCQFVPDTESLKAIINALGGSSVSGIVGLVRDIACQSAATSMQAASGRRGAFRGGAVMVRGKTIHVTGKRV